MRWISPELCGLPAAGRCGSRTGAPSSGGTSAVCWRSGARRSVWRRPPPTPAPARSSRSRPDPQVRPIAQTHSPDIHVSQPRPTVQTHRSVSQPRPTVQTPRSVSQIKPTGQPDPEVCQPRPTAQTHTPVSQVSLPDPQPRPKGQSARSTAQSVQTHRSIIPGPPRTMALPQTAPDSPTCCSAAMTNDFQSYTINKV